MFNDENVKRLNHAAKVLVATAAEKMPLAEELKDSVIAVSDRLILSDAFTSVEVFQFFCPIISEEQFTKEIPNKNEEELSHLDEQGVAQIGKEVRFGEILVGKTTAISSRSMSTEEKLLAAIFNEKRARDCSLYYQFFDPGIIVGKEIITDKKNNKKISGVKIEVLVRRVLKIGDFLSDGHDHNFIVAKIIPQFEMPVFKHKRVDVLLPATAQFLFLRQDGQLWLKKVLGKTKAGEVKLEKMTLRTEEKMSFRSTGHYSLLSQLPTDESSCPAQKIKSKTAIALWEEGYKTVLREMLTIKADDINGRFYAYKALYTGNPVRYFDTPESLWRLTANLRALNLMLVFLDKERNEILPETFMKKNGDISIFNQPEETGKKKFEISAFKIKPAEKKDIRDIAYGKVKNPETFNYRTLKPINDGLFCEKIFGPEKSYACACGKYKGKKNEYIVCEKCAVEVTSSFVRRRRFGFIKLNTPVVHLWYLKSLASVLGLSEETLKKLVNFKNFLLTEINLAVICQAEQKFREEAEKAKEEKDKEKKKYFSQGLALLTACDFKDNQIFCGDILELEKILTEYFQLKEAPFKGISGAEAIKKLFQVKGINSAGYVFDTLFVLPPDLRPLVSLDNGKFATTDVNEIYRMIIIRNNRLGRLIELNAPAVILLSEQGMLQRAISALFDNAACKKPLVAFGQNNRPLSSLTNEFISAKEKLLEKRVDYSAFAFVIPDLQISPESIGMPYKMLVELFKPMVLREIQETQGFATLKRTEKFLHKEINSETVKEILKIVVKDHPVLAISGNNCFAAFCPVIKEDAEVVFLHPKAAEKMKVKFGEKLFLHLPLSEGAILELKNPMPPKKEKAEITIADLEPDKLVEYALSDKETALTDFDKTILGVD